MSRTFVGLTLLLLGTTASAALKVGDAAPGFKAQASLSGKEFTFSLYDALKKETVVVYFYPSAYTEGCNVQAHEFAVNYEKFTSAGATVVGVSLDRIDRLNQFSGDPEYCAGKLPVVSDANGDIAKAYNLTITQEFNNNSVSTMKNSRGEAIGHGATERTTFVITSDGRVVRTISGAAPRENVMEALSAVQQLRDRTLKRTS